MIGLDPETSAFLKKALRDCRPHLLRVGFFSALVNILYLAPTIYMMQVYDRVVPTGGIGTLLWLTSILGAAIGTLTLLDSSRSRLMVRAALQVNTSLAKDIMHRLLAKSGGRSETGSQALRELDTLRQTMTGPGMMAMFDAPWVPIYLIVAFLLHPALALLICVGGGILVGLAIVNERAIRDGNRKSNRALATSHAANEALVAKAEVIRTLGMRKALVQRNHWQRVDALLSSVETSLHASRFSALTKFVRMFLQSLALGVGAWLAVDGSISSGAIIAASVLLSRALQPIEQLVGAWPSIIAARQSIDSLAQLFAGEDGEKQYFLMPDPSGELELSNVTLRNSEGDGFIVRGVSAKIAPGELTGLIGPSGAGKSTTARLAAGAIRPDIGDVRIDGASFDDWDPDSLARHIGYMPQDYSLIPGTVAENISRFDQALGSNPEEVAGKIIDAARLVGIHETILRLPQGYETNVGGLTGFPISGGQTQRIALARAVYGQPKLLVLDEPSSALDGDGEQALVRAIAAAKAWGAGILLIAHRTYIMNNADRLVVMQGGTVTRSGPREEVMTGMMDDAAKSRPTENVVRMSRDG